MMEQWLLEILHALGRMFYTPLFYWVFILLFIAGARRIGRDRKNFGTKVYGLFSEMKQTILVTFVFGGILSTLFVIFGFVLTWEIIIVLSIVTILFSITGSFQWISASYTVGFTFVLVMILSNIPLPETFSQWLSFENMTANHFFTLALIICFLLFAEAMLLRTTHQLITYPSLIKSKRGLWIGEHECKKMTIIPILSFVPGNSVTEIVPFFPYFDLGTESYQLVLIPFIIGFQYKILGDRIDRVLQHLMKEKLLLAFILFAIIIASLYLPILTVLVIIMAIIVNEWIMYRFKINDLNKTPYFAPTKDGLKVLGVIPQSRGATLGIIPGETIAKVNGQPIENSIQFYEALQQSGAFFKLDIINLDGEIRFVQGAIYEEDYHDLGILFPEAPIKQRQTSRVEALRSM